MSCCGCCDCGQRNFPTASSKLGICTFWAISNALAAKSDVEYLHILVFNAAPTPWLPSTFAFIFYPAFRLPIFLEESFNEVFNASLQHQRAAMQDGACPITLGDKLARCVSGELNAITRWAPPVVPCNEVLHSSAGTLTLALRRLLGPRLRGTRPIPKKVQRATMRERGRIGGLARAGNSSSTAVIHRKERWLTNMFLQKGQWPSARRAWAEKRISHSVHYRVTQTS